MTTPEHRSGRQCPNGHSMDPNWVKCPYCEAEERGRKRTRRPEKAGAWRPETKVGDIPAPPLRRHTKVMPAEPAADKPAPPNAGTNRRIMGVLITYTWRPEGQMFAVREGKNYIGRGKISSDASHRDCDVLVTGDTRMSNEHALILCRHGEYEIADQKSSNGTFLDGEMLMTNQSAKLGNSAEIKTGDTLWSFIKIEAPGGERGKATSAPVSRPVQAEDKKSDKDPTFVR